MAASMHILGGTSPPFPEVPHLEIDGGRASTQVFLRK